MSGIKCKYDYPGISNFDRLSGRKLQMQDNNWTIAKFFYVALIILIIYSIACGDIKLSAIPQFLRYIR